MKFTTYHHVNLSMCPKNYVGHRNCNYIAPTSFSGSSFINVRHTMHDETVKIHTNEVTILHNCMHSLEVESVSQQDIVLYQYESEFFVIMCHTQT